MAAEDQGPLASLHAAHGPWEALWTLAKADRGLLGLAGLYALASGLVALAVPLAVQSLVNTIAFEAMWQPVVALAVALLFALGFLGLLTAMQAWVAELAQRRLLVRVGLDLAQRFPNLRAEAFDGAHGPELANRFFSVFGAQKAVGILLMDGAGVMAQTFVGLSLVALYHPALFGLDLLIVLAVLGIVLGLGRQAGPTTVAESTAKYELAAWLEELARAPLAVASPVAAQGVLARADALVVSYLRARSAHFRVVMRQLVAFLALQAVGTALLFAVGGTLVSQRELGLGQLVAAELVLAGVLAGLVKWVKHLEAAYDLAGSAVSLAHLVHLPQQAAGGEPWSPRPGQAAWALETLSVGREGYAPCLVALNRAWGPGEHVAWSGPMGVGLSTLAEVVAGQRQARAGRVLLGGVDQRSVGVGAWQAQVRLVRPEGVLPGRVLDTLRWHDPELSLEGAEAALALVGLAGRVLTWPEGLATELAPGGAPLSRGEATLLALASATVGEPKLLVLDGLLDHLPGGEARQVVLALTAPGRPWNLVLITRRPELAALCPQQWDLGAP